jgi:hypothetical protein
MGCRDQKHGMRDGGCRDYTGDVSMNFSQLNDQLLANAGTVAANGPHKFKLAISGSKHSGCRSSDIIRTETEVRGCRRSDIPVSVTFYRGWHT